MAGRSENDVTFLVCSPVSSEHAHIYVVAYAHLRVCVSRCRYAYVRSTRIGVCRCTKEVTAPTSASPARLRMPGNSWSTEPSPKKPLRTFEGQYYKDPILSVIHLRPFGISALGEHGSPRWDPYVSVLFAVSGPASCPGSHSGAFHSQSSAGSGEGAF